MESFDYTKRLFLLRQEMRNRRLEAFILPMEDYHFSEYLADADKRIAFLSGFLGSAGTAVITSTDKAAFWTDGRYHEQAARELDNNWTLMRDGLPDVPSIPSWLVRVTPPSCQIGFDPSQMPFVSVRALQRQLDTAATELHASRSLVPIKGANLVDLVWRDRPFRPTNSIRVVPVESFAGNSWETKIDIIREQMKSKGVTTLVVFQLDEIAWLFNLRGSDINYNPLFFSYAVITMKEVHLFVDWHRGSDSVDLESYFRSQSHPVFLHPYIEFPDWIESDPSWKSGRVWLPPTSSHMIASAVPKKQRLIDISPISSLKAVKNRCEVDGMRFAGIVDSLALCDFLAWLDDMVQCGKMDPNAVSPCDAAGVDPPMIANEASLAAYLDAIRLAADGCLGLSFPTIPGADSNGSVIHYKVGENKESNQLTSNSIFLIDSGGQYSTGTMDTTRTVHLGLPTKEQMADYTQVLKAHASLASLTFPDNTAGTLLDAICRASMWRSGRNFAHGTGHGVGANLCVHEGPIGMSGRHSRILSDMGITEPGIRKNMVLTIEPGYYLKGKYGIRLENVVLVVESTKEVRNSSIPFLTFEALSLVPFQRRFIDPETLSAEELKWVNAYHAKVREQLLSRIALEAERGGLSPARKRTSEWILRETELLLPTSNSVA